MKELEEQLAVSGERERDEEGAAGLQMMSSVWDVLSCGCHGPSQGRSARSQIPETDFRRVVWIGDDHLIISLQMTTEVKGLQLHKAKCVQLKIETLFRNTNI